MVQALHPELKICQICIVEEQIQGLSEGFENENRRRTWEKKKQKR